MASSQDPIFIVGSSRSGTSLLAAMLSSHSRIACGPETQVLNKIPKEQLPSILADPKWPRLAIEALSKITLADQRVIDIYELSVDTLTQYLSSKPQTIASLFECFTVNFADRHGKKRWAEKTPRHLLHLDTIRKEFPNAKIIRIVRDPRDSALSMRQLNWTSEDYLPNLYIWTAWYEKTDAFFHTDQGSITIRYEDLAQSPKEVLKKLCRFIDEEFESSMLETSKSGKLVSTSNEVWKKQVSENLDTSRCYRWKKELSKIENLASEYLTKKWLLQFGYNTSTHDPRVFFVYDINTRLIEQNRDLILLLAEHGYSLQKANKPIEVPSLNILLSRKEQTSLRQRKNIFRLLVKRATRLKTTSFFLSPDMRLKRKEKMLLKLTRTTVYKLPITSEKIACSIDQQ